MPEPRDPLLKVLTIFIYNSDSPYSSGFMRRIGGRGPEGTEAPRRPDRSPVGPPKQQGMFKTRVGGWAHEGALTR